MIYLIIEKMSVFQIYIIIKIYSVRVIRILHCSVIEKIGKYYW